MISGIIGNVMAALKQKVTLAYYACPFRLTSVSVNVKHVSIDCSCTMVSKTEKMLRISYSYKRKGEFSFLWDTNLETLFCMLNEKALTFCHSF